MKASSELGETVVQSVQFGEQLAFGDPPVAVQRMLPGADEEAGQFQQRAVAACDVGDLQAEVVAVEDRPLQKRRRCRGGTVDQAWTVHRSSNRVSSHFAVASARPPSSDHWRSAWHGRSCRASSGSSLWLQSEFVP